MKYGLIIIIAIFTGCINHEEKGGPKHCLQEIDSIAISDTFREATALAELCVQQNANDTKLNLKLAELYLLSKLVDGDDNGLKKASSQFSKALTIDPSFASNSSEFHLDARDLSELSEAWFAMQDDAHEQERERFLIWALIEKFDPDKAPKLIK